jgi:bacteriocin-like protein
MDTKNLMSRSVKPVNRFTRQDFPTGLVELSEKDLKHIVGGCCCCCCCCNNGGNNNGGNKPDDDKTVGDVIGALVDRLIKTLF